MGGKTMADLGTLETIDLIMANFSPSDPVIRTTSKEDWKRL